MKQYTLTIDFPKEIFHGGEQHYEVPDQRDKVDRAVVHLIGMSFMGYERSESEHWE